MHITFLHQRVLNEWSWLLSSVFGPCFPTVHLSLPRSLWVSQPASSLLASLPLKPIWSFNIRPPSPRSLLQSLEWLPGDYGSSSKSRARPTRLPNLTPAPLLTRDTPLLWRVSHTWPPAGSQSVASCHPSLLPDDNPSSLWPGPRVPSPEKPTSVLTVLSPDCPQPLFPSHLLHPSHLPLL